MALIAPVAQWGWPGTVSCREEGGHASPEALLEPPLGSPAPFHPLGSVQWEFSSFRTSSCPSRPWKDTGIPLLRRTPRSAGSRMQDGPETPVRDGRSRQDQSNDIPGQVQVGLGTLPFPENGRKYPRGISPVSILSWTRRVPARRGESGTRGRRLGQTWRAFSGSDPGKGGSGRVPYFRMGPRVKMREAER